MSVVNVPLVKGTSVITMTGIGVAAEAFIIGDQTYTYRAVPGAEANAVDVLTDETTQAVAMRDAINASGTAGNYGTATVANPYVSATAAAGVVTITARIAGDQINGIAMEATLTNGTNITAGTAFADSAGASAGTGLLVAFLIAALTGLVDPKAKTISLLREMQ